MIFGNVKNVPWDARRWPNFQPHEIACQHGNCPYCGGEVFLDADAMDTLQKMRTLIEGPLTIISGHRCVRHNEDVGGAKKSAHLHLAFDIALGNYQRAQLFLKAREAGFKHFGFMKFGLHIDTRAPELAAPMWAYGPTSRELWKDAWKELGFKGENIHDA